LSKTNHLKSAYTNPSQENIEGLIEHLRTIGGRSLTTICRRQNAFRTSWGARDVKLIARCHIQNAAEYLDFIKTNHSNDQIKATIADLSEHVKILDSNEDVTFILISTNTLPSAAHFDAAKQLFFTHQIRQQNQNNYSTDILTLYSIRLSLESRVRRLLGIDYATSNGNNIGLSTLIKVAKGLQSVEYANSFNWTEIEWANNWLNHHMHRHMRPYPWIIYQAIETLKSFIDPKEPLRKEDKVIHSFNSATYVADENELKKEIESALLVEYPAIRIKWLSRREILKNK